MPGDSDDRDENDPLLPWVGDPDDVSWDPKDELGDGGSYIVPAEEEDKRASLLAKMESGARTLDSISRHVTTLAMRLLLAGTAICLVFKPELVPWLKGVLDIVLKDALNSGYGLTVPLVVAVTVFRKELTSLVRRVKKDSDS